MNASEAPLDAIGALVVRGRPPADAVRRSGLAQHSGGTVEPGNAHARALRVAARDDAHAEPMLARPMRHIAADEVVERQVRIDARRNAVTEWVGECERLNRGRRCCVPLPLVGGGSGHRQSGVPDGRRNGPRLVAVVGLDGALGLWRPQEAEHLAGR